jgi:hypothetical protein
MKLFRRTGLELIQKNLNVETTSKYQKSLTWIKTINVKGSGYSTRELDSMRRPGEPACRQILSPHQLSDNQVLDGAGYIKNPSALEAFVGFPLADLELEGEICTSHSVIPRKLAFKISERLQSLNKKRYVVLEIGAGVGLLAMFTKLSLGGRLSYVIVDIPETLQLSYWVLTGAFPDANHYVVTDETRLPNQSDIDFFYVVPSAFDHLDLEVDFVVNCNSFGEMSAQTSNAYIRKSASLLSEGGFLYVSNIFGADAASSRTPADCEFPSELAVIECDNSTYYEYAGPNYVFFNILFKRKRNRCSSVQHRNSVLKFLYFATSFGVLGPKSNYFSQLIERKISPIEVANDLISEPHSSKSDILRLISQEKYSPRHTQGLSFHDATDPAEWDWPQSGEFAVRKFQYYVIEQISNSEHKAGDRRFRQNVSASLRATTRLLRQFGGNSDFYRAYLACAALAISDEELIRELLADTTKNSSPYWKLRYCWILESGGIFELARREITNVQVEDVDQSWHLMVAQLLRRLGKEKEANRIVKSVQSELTIDSVHTLGLPLLKYYAHFGDSINLRFWFLQQLGMFQGVHEQSRLLTFIKEAIPILQACRISACDFDYSQAQLFSKMRSLVSHVGFDLNVYFALIGVNEVQSVDEIVEKWTHASYDDYFSLATIARLLLSIGKEAEATQLAIRSSQLRGGVSKHDYFLGSLFFSNKLYATAAQFFEASCEATPEDIVARGHAAYCRAISPCFWEEVLTPDALPLIFQRDQTFYYGIGPIPR